MSKVTVARAAILAVLLSTCAVGSDKTPHIYQKGTIKGWENRTDICGAGIVGTDGEGVLRNETVFEWKGTAELATVGPSRLDNSGSGSRWIIEWTTTKGSTYAATMAKNTNAR